MKLKLDENGHVVVKGGFPVWVAEDGADARRDNPASSGMITSTKTELQIPQ